jgi:hypothetical protein
MLFVAEPGAYEWRSDAFDLSSTPFSCRQKNSPRTGSVRLWKSIGMTPIRMPRVEVLLEARIPSGLPTPYSLFETGSPRSTCNRGLSSITVEENYHWHSNRGLEIVSSSFTELKELFDSGLITQSEYEAAKAKLLGI